MSLRKTKKQAQPESKIYIGSKVFDVFLILFMLILSVIFLYPFLNVVATSLSSNRMITTGQVTFSRGSLWWTATKCFLRSRISWEPTGTPL